MKKAIRLNSIVLFGWLFISLSSLSGQEDNSEVLFTNTYPISPQFITRLQTNSEDPFADQTTHKTIQERLEAAGIEFPPGASASPSGRTSMVIVRNTKAQLERVDAYFEAYRRENSPKQLTVFLEYIEVEAAKYHDWMFENRISTTGTPLRKEVQQWVKSGDATIIETTSTLVRSSQRAKVESVSEKIYPTETGTPGVPNEVLLEGKDTKAPIEGATPSAFETRNVGTTFEVDPVLGADNFTVDLNLSPEIVTGNGLTDWPPENSDPMFTISMPRFHAMKITTQVTTLHREYILLGTCKPLKPAMDGRKKPIVLVFARADVAVLYPRPQ